MIGSVLRVRYELVSQLGDGPIFSTFLARDRVAGREATVRLLKPPFNAERSFIDALSASIRQTQTVNHPGVERIDEIDDDQGQPFMVGPHSPGVSLTERLHKLAPFSVPVSVGTAISILEGLDALHSAGVVHGDVGSHNVVVGADGSTRLQMAGIWRAYSHSSTAGAVVLPVMAAYLAPEISAGSLPSATSDVYSVGVLLYELLCGRLPYGAETPVAMAMKHATAPTPSIRTYCPSAPMVLDEIAKRAMQKDPSLRYKNAGALLSDLRILQDALRFGRSLTWPLRPEAAPAASGVVGVGSAKGRMVPNEPKVQPVAPRMSAIRDERREAKQKKEYTGDVPAWIWWIFLTVFAVVVTVVFMWGFINLHKAKLITVPSLVGRDVGDARQTLRALGIEMREGEHESSDVAPAQTILRTDPEAGDKVRENGVVNVVVSTGSRQVEVPTLRGETLDYARSAISRLDLQLADPIDRIASDAPANTIVDQDPAPHQLVEKHSVVHIRVSTGTSTPTDNTAPPTPPTKPDGKDKTPVANKDQSEIENTYALTIKLTDALTSVNVKVEVEDSHGVQTLDEGDHEVNDEIPIEVVAYGPRVTFRIYYDGDLKKTIVRNAPNAANPGRRRRRPAATQPSTPPPDDTLPPQTNGQPDQQQQ